MAVSVGPPPEEVRAPPKPTETYLAWRATTDLRAPYRIAPEFLTATKQDADFDTDDCPLIVFINARSGGRVGPELAAVLARALGNSQVFDLARHRPDKVLRQIWTNFQEQERQGNSRAALVRTRLRILACGGDGTVAWILKVIKELDIQPQPAVAIMPLGTGNDLSRSFRWGHEFERGWIKCHASVYATLKRVSDARVTSLDCWRLRLSLPDGSFKPAQTYAMTEVQQQVAQPKQGGADAGPGVIMEGMFWNYFSIGADAQATYNFHHLRDHHPVLASNRVANQFWYSTFGCTSGWFCGGVPSVSSFSKLQVLLPGASAWTPLQLPASIKALVLVNLQSYAGGRNIWGDQPSKHQGRWRQPNVSDGLIEVVGFRSGYHATAILATGAKLANGTRLAQVVGIRLALQSCLALPDHEPGKVFMQLDGEPWLQHVPGAAASNPVMLEVVHAGVSKVLCNATEPDTSPESKMTEMLSKQQAAAYLAAKPVEEATADDQLQGHRPQLAQQQLQEHIAAGSQPAVAAGVHDIPASPSSLDAGVCLQPPRKKAHTDGGVRYGEELGGCSIAAAAATASLSCHSIDISPTGHETCSSVSTGSPASSGSTGLPSAVAVVETRYANNAQVPSKPVHAGYAQMLGVKASGDVATRPATLPSKQVPPAFVQLARHQATEH